jgi:hypothetical protein
LIAEDFEQARVIVALLVSVAFLSLHFAVRPVLRTENSGLMTLADLALILIYVR